MGPKVGRKRSHHGIRDIKRGLKTKARTRDLDNIFEDMKPENKIKLQNQAVDPELPGFGQHYCVECSRHFVANDAFVNHLKTKLHKRRVKILLTEKPYTQKEAEAAAGLN
ncbi:hypothetical protein BC833DRAFT_548248 [Globomyces pollinis-pini]|nr:hypothetical protein BC833DRAFT_548248 [Globomyces pollinis-pini]